MFVRVNLDFESFTKLRLGSDLRCDWIKPQKKNVLAMIKFLQWNLIHTQKNHNLATDQKPYGVFAEVLLKVRKIGCI